MSKLHHGDCLEIMQKIPAQSVDLILCDLPYGTSDRTGLRQKGANRLYQWDCEIDMDELWAHYTRILAADGNVVLTADQPFTAKLIMSNLEWFKYDLIWDKCRVNGFLHANSRPMKQTEDIVVFSPLGAAPASRRSGTHMKYNPQGLVPVSIKKINSAKRLGNFLHTPQHMGANGKLLGNSAYEQKFTNYPKEILRFPLDKCLHPTQKPVALMEYLIRTYSNRGDTVLDNCMGAGSTGVAAVNCGREFTGIEINAEFFSEACARMKAKPSGHARGAVLEPASNAQPATASVTSR
ncbi:MAG: site-specific DNA-methyltransferase [Gammaproteobacteria bacterium]